MNRSRDGFKNLKDPQLLSDWRRRFELAGSQSTSAAWEKILDRELLPHDYSYLTYLLERETDDIYVPDDLLRLFQKLYRAYILKDYTEDPEVPRAPLILAIGASGSGKTATIRQAVEKAVFASEVRPVVDLQVKREEALAKQPFWRSLADVDPELAVRIERRRKLRWLQLLARVPMMRYLYRGRISRSLQSLQQEGVLVDYAMVTPNDYQTAWAGEPGNYLRKAMGDPGKTCIRHLEEAHSAFGRSDQMSSVKQQQASLVDASNVILDEIVFGRRDCLLIATSDQPEQFESSIYRRFVERGLVIDLNELWEKPENLREVLKQELKRHNFRLQGSGASPGVSDATLDAAVGRLYPIFKERSLRINPAYVRRLLDSVIALKGEFRAEFLDDQFLVRDALKSVAKNVHGAIYKKVVGRMDRSIPWKDYIGGIKNEFSEMANNSLFYSVSEEKGVVLTGPPGSGKTFMVRAWLGDNTEVQDLVVNLNDLADPVHPLDGMVENLERVYDVAKMLSPAMVFFDEGDALAPRRSQQGGNPYDKVTNKFLSLIDGESPLNRVFTVLTTNRLDILDPALIRSKRLKVLNVTGHLRDEDALRILRKELRGIPLEGDLDLPEMVKTSRSLCETPADFAAFGEKIRSLRATEREVLEALFQAADRAPALQGRFVRSNYKILLGLLEAVGGDLELMMQARSGEEALLARFEEVTGVLRGLYRDGTYPVTRWHFLTARLQLLESPMRKGRQQLDEFLETELSREPQVGFVVGVGANEQSGVLLPIASSLIYRVHPEKILVTGAVSTSAPGSAELDLAVQMTRQSAAEALTLVENYLQSLCPELNLPRILGEFLEGYSLHHQLLSASYNVGGPSAGFALAINSLSVLLNLPVNNDFGITGAPWIKGARSGEVGSSVIIGGHRKKTEKVLQYLRRMYLPERNFRELEPELLQAYRLEGKEVRGVGSFSALVPEVFIFSEEHSALLVRYLGHRQRAGLGPEEAAPEAWSQLEAMAKELRALAEAEVRRRIQCIRCCLASGGLAEASLDVVFRKRD